MALKVVSEINPADARAAAEAKPVAAAKRKEEHALVGKLLDRDGAAWREFFGHYRPLLRRFLRWKFATALETVFSNDTLDEVLGVFGLAIVARNMAALRVWYGWGWRERKLSTAMAKIAFRIARDHLKHANVVACVHGRKAEEARLANANRGDRWTAATHAITVPMLSVSDPTRGVVHVWFGDNRVVIYELDSGDEVGSFHIIGRFEEDSKLSASKARAAIWRVMNGTRRQKPTRTTKRHRTH